ncbi:MAG TPA: xanthine dehydrogenase family protein subunit M [Candidatus Limnocylindrales bacterium]|nr:xanthine dehydrogenase family protein subunit M [Candidatus Limnocylindrales bacterium]
MSALAVEPPVESPRSLDEAYEQLASSPPARAIAGGTDAMVQLAGEIGEPPARFVDLWRLDELRGIVLEPRALSIGALTTYTELRRSALAGEVAPALVEAAATIGAAQIQNRGTIGGNLGNASPAGDTLPVLLALDAEVIAGSVRGERPIPIVSFFRGYRQTALEPDELILRVRLPIVPGRESRFRKVGTRRAQAISKVVLAIAWLTDGPTGVPGGGPWRSVRVALGSVAPTPIRVSEAEAALESSAPTPEAADRAAEALAAAIHPIDDVRSTAEYRRLVAARVLHRLVRDVGGW